MKHLYSFRFILPLLMVLLLIAYAFKQTNQRPQEKKLNVIVLLADDLGKHELSAYGGVHVPTPHH